MVGRAVIGGVGIGSKAGARTGDEFRGTGRTGDEFRGTGDEFRERLGFMNSMGRRMGGKTSTLGFADDHCPN